MGTNLYLIGLTANVDNFTQTSRMAARCWHDRLEQKWASYNFTCLGILLE